MKNLIKLNKVVISSIIILLTIVLTQNIFSQPGGGPIPTAITTGQIVPLSYCAGDSIFIAYTDTGSFALNNVFTAELSDPFGDFSSPVVIGSSIIQMGGVISCLIPWSTITGTSYRVRVMGSEPYTIGVDNGEDIEIKAKVAVSFTGNFPDQCENLTTLDLTTYALVSPSGGQFSGPGVIGTNFSAFDAGSVGSPHIITYTYSDGIGCANTATNQIEVLPFQPVTITNLDTFYCTNFHSVSLIGSPAGGTFAGNGILGGNIFNPGSAGAGYHLITYSYTASNGCSDVYSQYVEVEKCTEIFEADNNYNNGIKVFPNPSNGVLYVDIKGKDISNLRIYSVQGTLIKDLIVQQGEKHLIDLSFVSSGIYFINIDNKISIIEIKN